MAKKFKIPKLKKFLVEATIHTPEGTKGRIALRSACGRVEYRLKSGDSVILDANQGYSVLYQPPD